MRTVVLCAYRSDGGLRDRLWAYTREWWQRELPDYPLTVGVPEGDGPFSFSRGINLAAKGAGDWDTAVYIGADWIADTAVQVREAVGVAEMSGQLTIAHHSTCHLRADATDKLLNGADLHQVWEDGDWNYTSFSGVVAIPRILWDAVGGFDERFKGWGFEDMAMWSACCAMGRGFQRVQGVIVHLWHPTPRELREGSLEHAENEPIGRRYIAAKDSYEQMMEILHEPGGPLAARAT